MTILEWMEMPPNNSAGGALNRSQTNRPATAFLALFSLSLLLAAPTPSPTNRATAQSPDVRFVLQTQAGLAAYATLTDTISLSQVRPLFSAVAFDGPDYLQGSYTLAGRGDGVQLAIGAAGWVVAWQPRDQASQDFFDCPGFDGSHPERVVSRPERAVAEVAAALGITSTAASFYDFRHPPAQALFLHWLFLLGNGSQSSTLNLPLANTYLERGYVFCTALSNSKLWLNDELIDQQGSLSSVVYRAGALTAAQLRAGQTNTLKIEDVTIFGSGFLGGVSSVYSGTAPLAASGGYSRTLPLAYPLMLGQPLTIYPVFLPVTR
jgi:hypothetical protein